MRAQDEECWKGEEEREAEAARDDGRGGGDENTGRSNSYTVLDPDQGG